MTEEKARTVPSEAQRRSLEQFYEEAVRAARTGAPVDHTAEHEMSPYFKEGPRCVRCGCDSPAVNRCDLRDYRRDREMRATLSTLNTVRPPAPTALEPYQGPLSAGLSALTCGPFYRLR